MSSTAAVPTASHKGTRADKSYHSESGHTYVQRFSMWRGRAVREGRRCVYGCFGAFTRGGGHVSMLNNWYCSISAVSDEGILTMPNIESSWYSGGDT